MGEPNESSFESFKKTDSAEFKISEISDNDPDFNNNPSIACRNIFPFLKEKSPISYKDLQRLKKHEKVFGIIPNKESSKYIQKRLQHLKASFAKS